MQMFVLLLVMSLMAREASGIAIALNLAWWSALAWSIGLYALPTALAWYVARRARRQLIDLPAHGNRTLKRLYRLNTLNRALILTIHLADIFIFDLPGVLSNAIGSWVLVNDVLLLAPPLACVSWMWWVYYPIDRHFREHTLLRQLDDGTPVFSFQTPAAYVLEQFRHQVLLILAPLLVLIGWMQFVQWLADRYDFVAQYASPISLIGALAVFALAPLLLRYIWRTQRMANGPLRERLLGLCRTHRVRINELLLWRTHGGLINGAVMGLFARARFILLTDGLIEQMDDDQIEAVMAHELGHVRRHHMPWMAVCALALIAGFSLLMQGGYWLIEQAGALAWLEGVWPRGEWVTLRPIDALTAVGAGGVAAGWFVVFGYVSRRFERQADTFAAQHLSRDDPHGLITEAGAQAMAGALRSVSDLNHQPTSRKSWRHGSIDWRVDYLMTLPGQAAADLKIDRQVRAVCWLSLLALVAILLLTEVDLATV